MYLGRYAIWVVNDIYPDKSLFGIMPKWKKDETEFPVSVGFNEVKGYWVTVPKPIIEFLGKPDRITFLIKGKTKVEVIAGETSKSGWMHSTSIIGFR